jgi:hypothetical protein
MQKPDDLTRRVCEPIGTPQPHLVLLPGEELPTREAGGHVAGPCGLRNRVCYIVGRVLAGSSHTCLSGSTPPAWMMAVRPSCF